MSITRRLFLRNSAAAGAVAATVATPVIAEARNDPYDRALHHWREFQAAIGEILPADCRLQVFGSVTGFRVDALRKMPDEVRPGVFITIERTECAAHWIAGSGWVARGRVA
jgi:hypothetical protein